MANGSFDIGFNLRRKLKWDSSSRNIKKHGAIKIREVVQSKHKGTAINSIQDQELSWAFTGKGC